MSEEPIKTEHCEGCGTEVPSFDTVILSSPASRTPSRRLCSRCFNQTIATGRGIDFAHPTFEAMTLRDIDGAPHVFHFRSQLAGPGLCIEAFEIKDGHPAGFELEVLGEATAEPLDLFRRLYERIRRTLARKHIVEGQLGPTIGDDNIVRGQITWDDESHGRLPRLVIDGKDFSWEELGRMVMSYEGFQFRLEIFDRSDEP